MADAAPIMVAGVDMGTAHTATVLTGMAIITDPEAATSITGLRNGIITIAAAHTFNGVTTATAPTMRGPINGLVMTVITIGAGARIPASSKPDKFL